MTVTRRGPESGAYRQARRYRVERNGYQTRATPVHVEALPGSVEMYRVNVPRRMKPSPKLARAMVNVRTATVFDIAQTDEVTE